MNPFHYFYFLKWYEIETLTESNYFMTPLFWLQYFPEKLEVVPGS